MFISIPATVYLLITNRSFSHAALFAICLHCCTLRKIFFKWCYQLTCSPKYVNVERTDCIYVFFSLFLTSLPLFPFLHRRFKHCQARARISKWYQLWSTDIIEMIKPIRARRNDVHMSVTLQLWPCCFSVLKAGGRFSWQTCSFKPKMGDMKHD